MDLYQRFPRHDGHSTSADTHSALTMDHMDHGSGSSSSHSQTMMSVFHTDMATSLFSTRWTPSNRGTYAATCIFLIALAAIFRALLAFRSWQEQRWLDRERNRRYVVVNGKAPLAEALSRDEKAKHMTMVLSANGVEESVMVVANRSTMQKKPWRWSVDPLRAALDTVIAGVGYLM